MKRIVVLPSFERSLGRLTDEEKKRAAESLGDFNVFLVTSRAPFGFRLKKIGADKYEFRIDSRLRIITKEEKSIFYLVLAGSHDEVRRYLKNYR